MKRLARAFANQRLGIAPLLLALACACAWPASAQAAEPLRIENLRVEGGEASWHASRVFRLDWTQLPGLAEPITVIYRLFDADGNLIEGPVRYTENAWLIEQLEVPPVPGAYTIELRLEDDQGNVGPPSRATLRFDNEVPSSAAPLAPDGWLAGHEIAELKIGHPPGPLPLSGIRGYAISLDRGEGSYPCAHPA